MWARHVESAMDRREWVDREEGDRTTIGAALSRYAREITPQKALSTQARDRRRITQIQSYPLVRIALAKLGGKDVAEHIRYRQRQGAGANTIRLELAMISHLYTVARSAWGMSYLINPVPLAKTARPPTPAYRPGPAAARGRGSGAPGGRRAAQPARCDPVGVGDGHARRRDRRAHLGQHRPQAA